jgi:hypothetical protein
MRGWSLLLLTALVSTLLWAVEDEETRIDLKPGIAIGSAVPETCTRRCHIDFPFDITGRFNHQTHTPARGFECDFCHIDEPLPSEEHGKLALSETDCGRCHHDLSRFPTCDLCHLPVVRHRQHVGSVFDHETHAYIEGSPPCLRCHDQLGLARAERRPLDCLACHHVLDNPPTECTTCHEAALSLHESAAFADFDHGRHAVTTFLDSGCCTCHDRLPMAPPETMDCVGCHHPLNKESGPACRVCHDDVDKLSGGKRGTFFRHEPHVRQRGDCTVCHALDPLRTPLEGLNCGKCHHQRTDGCRDCHQDRIYFVRMYDEIPAANEPLPFLHAVHELNGNCSICHLTGEKIRLGFEAFSCADCHHHSGHPPGCGFCHSGIEEIRSGRMPSGRRGPAEVMYGIVACEDCHGFDPSAYKGMEDGRSSCSRCHPEEYIGLLDDARQALLRASESLGLAEGRVISSHMVRKGMHNYRLALEELTEPPPAPGH